MHHTPKHHLLVHSLMVTEVPAPLQQDNAPWHTAKPPQEWGVDLASKFPRSQPDWVSMGYPRTSQIHTVSTVVWTCLWIFKVWTKDLQGCSVVSGTRAWVAESHPQVTKWGLIGTDFFWHTPLMPDWIGISGIWPVVGGHCHSSRTMLCGTLQNLLRNDSGNWKLKASTFPPNSIDPNLIEYSMGYPGTKSDPYRIHCGLELALNCQGTVNVWTHNHTIAKPLHCFNRDLVFSSHAL